MDDLVQLADEQAAKAAASAHGRSAHLLVHDGVLRQTVIALTAGTALDEHNAPSAASLQVLRGRVSLTIAGRLAGAVHRPAAPDPAGAARAAGARGLGRPADRRHQLTRRREPRP